MKTILAVTALAASLAHSVQANEDWRFSLSPYVWFAGVKGDVATVPRLPAAPIDISPSDAFDDNEASYMLILSAMQGRHGLMMDFNYTDTRSKEDLIPQLGLQLRSTSQNTLFSVGYVFQFFADTGSNLDGFVGARYWDIETTLEFRGGQGLLAGRKIKNSEDWIDPMIGLKGRTPIGNSRFYLTGWVAVGGFDVNSSLFYDTAVNLGYQWSDSIGTTLGYRLFDVDYDEKDFLYDVQQDGVMLGLTWKF